MHVTMFSVDAYDAGENIFQFCRVSLTLPYNFGVGH